MRWYVLQPGEYLTRKHPGRAWRLTRIGHYGNVILIACEYKRVNKVKITSA